VRFAPCEATKLQRPKPLAEIYSTLTSHYCPTTRLKPAASLGSKTLSKPLKTPFLTLFNAKLLTFTRILRSGAAAIQSRLPSHYCSVSRLHIAASFFLNHVQTPKNKAPCTRGARGF
jgi:hypothetical protein